MGRVYQRLRTLARFFALYHAGDSVPDTPDHIPQNLPAREAAGYCHKVELERGIDSPFFEINCEKLQKND